MGLITLGMFFVLLAGLPVLRGLTGSSGVALFDAFYRSGALVLGGGHVVLPLLREAFVAPGWLSDDAFLAGYGAAQAVPGPLFTFAAYLGTVVSPEPHGLSGAALGLVGIFLPGILVLLGALPFWDSFRKRSGAQAMMRGSTPRWSACWALRSTIRCGQRPCIRHGTSALPLSASSCWSSGALLRLSSSPSAPPQEQPWRSSEPQGLDTSTISRPVEVIFSRIAEATHSALAM